MKYNHDFFDEPFDRRGTDCAKWDVAEKELGHIVNPMFVADMDFRSPHEIVDALVKRAQHPAYGYTEEADHAVNAMINFMKRRHGVELKPEEHVLLPGVVTGLRVGIQVYTEPGDGVIIMPPVYGPFRYSIMETGRTIVECPLLMDDNNRYSMDLNAVEEACKAGAKLLLNCNPHNPCGRLWTRKELENLWSVLKKYNVALVSDEIHEDFVFEKGAFVPMLTVATEPDDRVIACTSASKTFNLAGLHQAVAFGRDQEVIRRIGKLEHEAGISCGNIFGMVATEAAYNYGDDWLDGMLEYIHEGYLILCEEMKRVFPKAIITPLEATYLAWVDMRAYGLSADEIVARGENAGVKFTPGTFFGSEHGEGFIRINLACQHTRIREAVAQLAKAVL